MRHFFTLLLHGRFRELLLDPTDDGFIQFFRFLFEGGTATLVDMAVGWAFFHFVFLADLPLGILTLTRDMLSGAVGFLFGLVANYILSILWVFRKANVNRVTEFLAFAAIGLIGLLVKSGTMALAGLLLTAQTDLFYLIKSAIGTLVAMIWNFAARKLLLYRTPHPAD